MLWCGMYTAKSAGVFLGFTLLSCWPRECSPVIRNSRILVWMRLRKTLAQLEEIAQYETPSQHWMVRCIKSSLFCLFKLVYFYANRIALGPMYALKKNLFCCQWQPVRIPVFSTAEITVESWLVAVGNTIFSFAQLSDMNSLIMHQTMGKYI